MTETAIVEPLTRRSRRPESAGRRWLAIAVALLVGLAGYGTYVYIITAPPHGESTLVVYTYPSLFGGSCRSPVFASVFGAFGAAHHVHVQVECPAGTLLSTLLSQKNAPGADLVIGLDEITAERALSEGLLVPYASPQLVNVPTSLVTELSPEHAATPYEWGYLAIDYNTSFSQSTGGAVAHSAFPEFIPNGSWARQLLVEDPTLDITGQEFLVWEIQFYEQVLHQNWMTFWRSVDPLISLAPDWGTAFTEFTTPPNNPGLVVSYTTDAAYALANGQAGEYDSTVTNWNGTEYGWKTIYGIGVVAGSTHLALDQSFIDWFLSGTVQSQIPTNEWEYPANSTISLPTVFGAALNPSTIFALNAGTTPSEVSAALPGWLNEWQSIDAGTSG